jgi:hypothetical protein
MGSIVFRSNTVVYGGANSKNTSIYVDGALVGLIAQLGTLRWDLVSGVHSVRVRRLWTSSPVMQIEVTEHEASYIEVGYSAKGMKQFLQPLYAPGNYLTLKSHDGPFNEIQGMEKLQKTQKRIQALLILRILPLIVVLIGLQVRSSVVVVIGVAALIVTIIWGARLIRKIRNHN